MASFDRSASPRFAAFTLRTECPRCGAHLPANGPSPAVTCAACETRVDVPPRLVRELFDWFEDHWPDVTSSSAETIGDLTWRWTSAPIAGPACPDCRTELALGDDTEEQLLCHCGAVLTSEPVPRRMNEDVRSAARVYGADPDVLPEVIAHPVAMSCPQCGAGLTITSAHQRLTPCAHCGTSIHLPDAVWRALHPPRTVHPWVIRFDGESRPARIARMAREKVERERALAEKEAARRAKMEEERAARDLQIREESRARLEQERAALAEAKAREEAAEKRRSMLLLPLLAASWVGGFGGAVGLVLAAGWYAFGPLRMLVPYAPPAFWSNAPRPAMLLALAGALVGWGIVHAGAALRGRMALGAVAQFAIFFAVLANMPMVGGLAGPFLALRYVAGAEPTTPNMKGKATLAWRLPAAALLVAFGTTWLASWAAVMGIPVFGVGGMLERVLD